MVLLSALFIGFSSNTCDSDYYDGSEMPSCQMKIVNMSAINIHACVVGHKKATEEISDNLVTPTKVRVRPGEYGEKVKIWMNNKGNHNWSECFSDMIDMLYVAIAVDEHSIDKWLDDMDESRLLVLYKFSLDDLGADKKNKTVYYF